MNNISLIIPSHNNLRHLKNAYVSIKKHAPDVEMCIADDASVDGTYEWLNELNDSKVKFIRTEKKLGHTILYDKLINEVSTNEIISIFHADMIMGQNYFENILRYTDKGKVVSGTRIEPPLHPKADEKIIMDFGDDFDKLDINGFEKYVSEIQPQNERLTTDGIFAPWTMYKSDFQLIGGHDPVFAPFPYEDSDIFNRMLLNGFEFIQSWSALVYHLTCRGHRWTEEINKDDDMFKVYEYNARRNYFRKWGMWIENTKVHRPVVYPRYIKSLILSVHSNKNVDYKRFVNDIEPWFDYIQFDSRNIHSFDVDEYIKNEQPNTLYDLTSKFKDFKSDIIVKLNIDLFTQEDFHIMTMLPKIIQDSGEIGTFQIGNLEIEINKMTDISNDIIITDKSNKIRIF